MLHPLRGLSIANTGKEKNDFCCGYCTFSNIPRTCPLLTTWAHVGLRFDPHLILPVIIAGNEHREQRKGKNAENEDMELRHGTKTCNEGREPRMVIKTGNQDREQMKDTK